MEDLQFVVTWSEHNDPLETMDGENHGAVAEWLTNAQLHCMAMGFNVTAALIQDAIVRFSMDDYRLNFHTVKDEVEAIRRAVHTELKSATFLQLTATATAYYNDKPQFGEAVTVKFPKAVTDIQEAAKCFATARYTACVFHLMRVMEHATRYLGKKLGISLVGQKNWHNILDEVDRTLKAMPVRNSYQKSKRNRFAEASAHLRMVKDAWRNDVMHPKETYTEEEAERIFRNVKDFMVHLATKL